MTELEALPAGALLALLRSWLPTGSSETIPTCGRSPRRPSGGARSGGVS